MGLIKCLNLNIKLDTFYEVYILRYLVSYSKLLATQNFRPAGIDHVPKILSTKRKTLSVPS